MSRCLYECEGCKYSKREKGIPLLCLSCRREYGIVTDEQNEEASEYLLGFPKADLYEEGEQE